MKNMHPLASLSVSEDEDKEFVYGLSEADIEKLKVAIRYYEETLLGGRDFGLD